MGRLNKRAAKKHNEALKRREKKKKTPKQPKPPVASAPRAPSTLARAPNSSKEPVRYRVLEHTRFRHEPFPEIPGTPAGPPVLALAFGDQDIGLYRAEAGEYRLVKPHELPFDQQVLWANEWALVEEAMVEHVSWHHYPKQDGKGGISATLVVRTLVDTEEDTVWSPTVPVTAVPGGKAAWVLEAESVGGVFTAEALDWQWGTDDTHSGAICEFLDTQRSLLLSVLQGGPSLVPELLVQAIRGPSKRYKRGAVEALVAHREDVVPLLLEMLDEMIAAPQAFADQLGGDFDGLYAVIVLAHLRVTEAHARLLAIGRMNDVLFEALLGGLLTEGYDTALLHTLSDDLSGLYELVQDPSANEYLRSQAAAAMVGAVVLGRADRAEVLEVLAGQLRPGVARHGCYHWSGVASAMLDLCPVEYERELIAAYKSGLVEPFAFDLEYIHEKLTVDPTQVPQLRVLDRVEGVHDWLSWWACFDDDDDE